MTAKKEITININKKLLTYAVIAGLFFISGFVVAWPVQGVITGMFASSEVQEGNILLTIISDERCETCDTTGALATSQILFSNLEVKYLDYSDAEAKSLMESTGIDMLPAYIFDSNVASAENFTFDDGTGVMTNFAEAGVFVQAGNNYYIHPQAVGASFDPSAEICTNGLDDDGNGETDCADSYCTNLWQCVTKSDKPVVELFVMSHCPYGTQIEKGMLPVVDLLGDKIDFQLKFVDYAMHGQKEIDEELRQYCVEQEYGKDKLIEYLYCFLEDGDNNRCITELSLDNSTINSCVAIADAEYDITEDYNDKSTWRGSYPYFALYAEDNEKYSVQGSPTLIINGASPSAGRDSASLLEAVCYAFNNAPAECSTALSSASPSAGFGFSASTASTTEATCG